MNNYEEITKKLIELKLLNERLLISLNNEINYVIEKRETDEIELSKLFDSLLSLNFIDQEKLKKVYYHLSNYCMLFNPSLAEDYNKLFEELQNEEEIKTR